jgi:hypothetical protein
MDTEPGLIDPGETALAVIGVVPVISRKVEKIKASQRDEMANLPRSLKRLAQKLCRGELDAAVVDVPSYKPLLTDLTDAFDVAQIEATIEPLPMAMKLPFMTLAKNAFDLLQGALPKSVYQTSFNAVQLPISDVDFWKFAGVLQVLDNPLCVFALMSRDELLPSQVQAVQHIYPSLSQAIAMAIQFAAVDELSRVKSFELPLNAENGVATWFGNPPNPAPYQAAYVIQDAQKKAAPSGAPSSLAKAAADTLEQAQIGVTGK